jgi:hypothetical protein
MVSADPGGALAGALTGNGVSPASLTVSPASVGFDAVAVGSASREVYLTVTNRGQSPTGALAMSLTGGAAASFAISSNECPTILDASSWCYVGVTFKPSSLGPASATLGIGDAAVSLAGTGTATLTVVRAGTGTGTVTSSPAGIACGTTCSFPFSTGPVSLSATADPLSEFTGWSGAGCSGTGSCVVSVASAATVTATFNPTPALLSIAPTGHAFLTVTVGDSAGPVSFTVTNSGGAPSDTLTTSVTDGADFTVVQDSCAGKTIGRGSSCVVSVRFDPASPGDKSATLTVGDAAADLSGTATGSAVLALSSEANAFGLVPIGGASTTAVFKVTNEGPVPSGTPSVALNGADFAISSNGCTAALGPKGTCSIGVQFRPAHLGAESATLSVSATPGGRANASLTGTGTAQIQVSIPGGGGTVSSMPAGISCPGTCSATFSAPVTLSAMPAENYAFGGWSGVCSGTATCAPAAAATVTATFGCAESATMCGSTCVDLTTDPDNCGACGTSCAGGTCSAGVCQPQIIASGQFGVHGIAVDGTSVYWVTSSAGNASDGTVMKAPVAGGAATTLATGQAAPRAIAIDATNVYWTNFYGNSVMKVGLDGGTPVMLASGSSPMGLAVGSGLVVWTNVYTASQSIMAAPIDGNDPPRTLVSGLQYPIGVAIASGSVYFTDESAGTVSKMPLGIDGGLSVLASGQANPRGIAIDSTSVYFTDNTMNGTVMAVGLAGGTPTSLASDSAPYAVAVDADNVYFTSNPTTAPWNWRVMKAPLSGGTPTLLATGASNAYVIAVDSGYVYWSSSGDGTILRIAK